jgi:flagella basal body P-ring formation protein FlgA
MLSALSVSFPAWSAFYLDKSEAEETLKEALEDAGLEGDISVTITKPTGDVIATFSRSFQTEVSGLKHDKLTREVSARLMFIQDDTVVGSRQIYGRYEKTLKIPVLRQRKSFGEIIQAEDITYIDFPEGRLRSDAITTSEQLIGKALRRTTSADKPLGARDVESEQVVKRNQPIALIYKTDTVEIKDEGIAMQDGAIGDIIKVQNSKSGAEFMARVIAPRTASVSAIMNWKGEE